MTILGFVRSVGTSPSKKSPDVSINVGSRSEWEDTGDVGKVSAQVLLPADIAAGPSFCGEVVAERTDTVCEDKDDSEEDRFSSCSTIAAPDVSAVPPDPTESDRLLRDGSENVDEDAVEALRLLP